ncbi:MAG: hypothetical protein NVS1B4_24320 [Gemmatimonadaceae bacterium]
MSRRPRGERGEDALRLLRHDRVLGTRCNGRERAVHVEHDDEGCAAEASGDVVRRSGTRHQAIMEGGSGTSTIFDWMRTILARADGMMGRGTEARLPGATDAARV